MFHREGLRPDRAAQHPLQPRQTKRPDDVDFALSLVPETVARLRELPRSTTK